MEQLIGRYRPVARVASGGMGEVWQALDPAGRPVALKLLLGGAAAPEHLRRRFQVEVQALARVRHAGLVAFLDAGEHRGAPYLVTEWVPGETLAARLERAGPLPPRQAAELARSLAEALHQAHLQGVLHRDLKPDNVLLRQGSGQPLLTDFGLARDLLPAEGADRLTHSGVWLGTPGYWAPEQARGDVSALGPRTDVHGLGAVLYAALTGRAPRPGDSLQAHLAVSEQPPEPPGRLRPDVPPWLEAACLRALAADPARRQPDAAALAAELGAGLTAGHDAPGGQPARTAVLAAGVLLLGAGLAAGIVLASRAGRARSGLGEASLAPAAGTGAPSAGAPSAAAPADPLEPAFLEARRLLQAGDPLGALGVYDRILEQDPDCWRALHNRGFLRHTQTDFSGAARDLDRAVALRPDEPRSRSVRGLVRWALKDYRGAIEDHDQALARDPGLAQSWWGRGMARISLMEFRAALPDLDRAVELDPGNGRAWASRGGARLATQDLAGALEDFSRALELKPEEASFWSNRATARNALGDRAGALADLERSLELDPKRDEVRRLRDKLRQAQREGAAPAGKKRSEGG